MKNVSIINFYNKYLLSKVEFEQKNPSFYLQASIFISMHARLAVLIGFPAGCRVQMSLLTALFSAYNNKAAFYAYKTDCVCNTYTTQTICEKNWLISIPQ